MDPQLKTRLIGATIIVSLVVIFVPMLFEERSEDTVARNDATVLAEMPKSDYETQALPLPSSMPTPPAANLAPPTALPPSETTTQLAIPEAADDEGAALDPLDVPPQRAGAAAKPRTVMREEPVMAEPERPLPPPKPVAPAHPAHLADEDSAMPALTPPVRKDMPALPKAAATPSDKKPTATPSVTPAKTPAAPVSWMVQAGSFADENNAKTLQQKLRAAKVPAFVEKVTTRSGALNWRVRVGPEVERAKAEALLKKMDTDAGVKGILVSYP